MYEAKEIGMIPIKLFDGVQGTLSNVLCVLWLAKNLLSTRKMTDSEIIVEFNNTECLIGTMAAKVVAKGRREGNFKFV